MNDITLDFGATAQKQAEGETPVVLLALDQGRYDMDRSLAELTALAEANGMRAVAEVVQSAPCPKPRRCWARAKWPKRGWCAPTPARRPPF